MTAHAAHHYFRAKLSHHLLRTSQGFTLIELLVVIVIVGVLAGIAVPTFLNQVKRSRAVEAESAMAVSSTAITVYAFDCGSFTPTITQLATGVACSRTTGPWLEVAWSVMAPNFNAPPISAPTNSQKGSELITQGNNSGYLQISCRKGVGIESSGFDGCTIPN